MANAKSNGGRYKYAIIDTAPGADGYWCDAVSMSGMNARALFFSRRGGGVATVTIQFKTPESGAAWQDLTTDESLADGERFIIEDWAPAVKYRAGVKNGNYTSGTIRVGFEY